LLACLPSRSARTRATGATMWVRNDDARSALRWSLMKLRALRQRRGVIRADR
jgi:hypothetical protein